MSSPPRPHGGATVAMITIGEAECGILFCTIFARYPTNLQDQMADQGWLWPMAMLWKLIHAATSVAACINHTD